MFVMGSMDMKDIDKYGEVLHAEQKQFNDLVVGKFVDSYRNNTLKVCSKIVSFSSINN